MKRILVIAGLLATALPLASFGQTTRSEAAGSSRAALWAHGPRQMTQATTPASRQQDAPLVDHHAHIWSVNASAHVTEPLLPVIKVPEELERLLRDKEKFGGRVKDEAALRDLYTKDALVLDPTGPTWFRGERAVDYVIRGTVMNRLLPTAYEVNGPAGYVAGYEAVGEGASAEYASNFFYALRKGEDGKWRISAETFTAEPPRVARALTAEQLVKELDAAGIKRAAVLSVAYWFGSAFRKAPEDEYAKVRAENDWVAEQVARYPDRLVGFCSFNPLKEFALEELDRCAGMRGVKGLKLHFGNSGVDIVKNPQHVEKMRQVFRAANQKRLAIVAHLWTNPAYEETGREHAEVFLKELLPAAPDVTVQIAHMAGGGRSTDSALAVFADAIAAGDPRTKNLYFDMATLTGGQTDERLRRDAAQMRRIGLKRILYGTDAPPNPPARQSWQTFRERVPLTDAEFRTIAGNVAPYLR